MSADRASLERGSVKLDDVPRETLCDIVARREDILSRTRRNVLQDVKLCKGLLTDHCGEFKVEISVLVRALEERVPADLLAAEDAVPQEMLLARLSRRLQDRHGITEEAARWAVESWAFALGVVVCEQARETSKRENQCKPGYTKSSPRSAPSRLDPGDQFAPSELRPFVFASGESASTARELASLCDRHWDEAREYLQAGDFKRWFRGQNRNHIARRAQRIAERYGDQDEGLERFLEELDPHLQEPEWEISSHSVDFGSLAPEQKRSVDLDVYNRGRGYVRIRTRTRSSWLQVVPPEVGIRSGKRTVLALQADASKVPLHARNRESVLLAGSNGQQEAVVAELKISPLRAVWVRWRLPLLAAGLGAAIGWPFSNHMYHSSDGSWVLVWLLMLFIAGRVAYGEGGAEAAVLTVLGIVFWFSLWLGVAGSDLYWVARAIVMIGCGLLGASFAALLRTGGL